VTIESSVGIRCDLFAIPADERLGHIALVRTLLFGDRAAVRDLEDGYEFSLPPDRLRDVVTFVENERRCCAHLRFSLEVPAMRGPLVLRVTGPGAREELSTLL
jgi:hypothetical protein